MLFLNRLQNHTVCKRSSPFDTDPNDLVEDGSFIISLKLYIASWRDKHYDRHYDHSA